MNEPHLLFLGTGASTGVPVMGCSCATCQSTDSKNKRLRTSVLLSIKGKQILIDAGPDIRQQALLYQVRPIDALFLTHTHYDHVGGVEELRVFNFLKKSKLPCYLSESSMEAFFKLYYYHFSEKSPVANYTAEFDFEVLMEERGAFHACGTDFRYFSYIQGGMKVLGFRVGSLAYVTDIKEYPDTIFEDLLGIDTLIVSAQCFKSSHIQFTFDEAVEFATKVGAQSTYFTHLSHDIEYHIGEERLQQGMHLAYDGLKLPIEHI